MSELVHLDVAAGVATITLDSPANRNALSAQLRRELLGHLATALADDAVRVVAKVGGPTRAGGVGLVAACDIAVAATAATFAFSEVRIGVVPAVISVTVLPRLLPRGAHELFLTGETFDAARAVAVGLVNAAVPAEELDDEVARYVGMLRLGAPGALAATKEMLRAERPAAQADQFAEMLTLSARHFAGAEGQEGMRAFAEKRPPRWARP